jgi:hypothetical protein
MLAFYKEKKEGKIYNAMALEYFARIVAHEHKIEKNLVGDIQNLQLLAEQKKQLAHKKNFSMKTRMLLTFGLLFPDVFRVLFFRRQARLKKKYGGCD